MQTAFGGQMNVSKPPQSVLSPPNAPSGARRPRRSSRENSFMLGQGGSGDALGTWVLIMLLGAGGGLVPGILAYTGRWRRWYQPVDSPIRYAPLVAARGGRVVLQVYARVVPLLTQLPGVAAIIDTDSALPPFDVHCSLLSLPRVFGTDLDSIPAAVPYLTVPADRLAQWRRKLGPRKGLRVGVAWSGNTNHRDDARRSIPFDVFRTVLTDRPDMEFHVLQNELRAPDRAALREMPHVRNHADVPQDFGDAGALVSLMDVVISVDTSIAHLAGALDRPVWLLLAHLADWRWLLERDDSPWYPSMWLLRQQKRGDWFGVLSVVASRLEEMPT